MGSFVYRIDLVINYTQLQLWSGVIGPNRFVEVEEVRGILVVIDRL